MARATKRKVKAKTKAARPRIAKKAAARTKAPTRKAAAPARAAAPSPKVAELQAEIRRLRVEITVLQAKLGEVPAIAFNAPTHEQPAV
jgi:hypothetical protein